MMVKNLLVRFFFSSILLIGACYAAYVERQITYYTDLPPEGIKFYKKMAVCSPATYLPSMETVYGKTRDGRCHYSYKQYYKGDLTEFHCVMPMQVVIGYATTSLDIIEYYNTNHDLANERMLQNNEIRKLMLDYCARKV